MLLANPSMCFSSVAARLVTDREVSAMAIGDARVSKGSDDTTRLRASGSASTPRMQPGGVPLSELPFRSRLKSRD